ncbi:MFS transporter [Penicillium angulare]|uniref:MFS transporter n=1 Tax=Penicillium angulare TaxID=116970 RepID=A0A9W9F6E8_9EURO|nr:MFS transporter [Penicillium angulare]
MGNGEPWGAKWRSSSGFIMFTVVIGLFCQIFLYSYIVPVLSYMVEHRLQLSASQIQKITIIVLTLHGGFAVVMTPILTYYVNKTQHRKIPLLISLFWCFIGTLLIAFAHSLRMLVLGRALQAIAGCAGWIISFATIDDNINPAYTGKALRLTFTSLATAILTGPAISGVLLQFAGYWATWSVPLCILVMSFIARLIMLEDTMLPATSDETSSLLNSVKSPQLSPRGGNRICSIILSDIGFLVSFLNIMMEGIISTGFDTTLPIFLQRQFGMKPAAVGLIFLALQVPGVVISPFIGLLRSKMGLRFPTTFGWVIMALLFWLLGSLGKDVSSEITTSDVHIQRADMFVCVVIFIGFVAAIIRGAGMLQMKGIANNLQDHKGHTLTSEMYSFADIGFNSGAFVGPLLSGYVSEVSGFFYMTLTMGKSSRRV